MSFRIIHNPSNAIDVIKSQHQWHGRSTLENSDLDDSSNSRGSRSRSRSRSLIAKENFFPDTVDFGTTTSTSTAGTGTTVTASSVTSSPLLSSSTHSKRPINNKSLVYIPVRLPCGVQVYCAPDVLSGCPMVLRSIQTDLVQIFKLLPWSVHNFIRRTNIWINTTYKYGPRDNPKVLKHSTAHHHEAWLLQVANDRPEKARSIEIYDCYDFERMRLHWNGCGLLLHEICHLIHQFVFDLDNPQIVALYEAACQSGLYDRTLRRDWAGREVDYDMAYATIDQKEFFAEMMVTYLSDAYHELDKADNTIMLQCSPVLLQPSVTERVLKRYGIEDDPMEHTQEPFGFLFDRKMRGAKSKLRIANPVLQEYALARSCLDVKHCNKFYPFTRGQLRHHDPELFRAMRALYQEIVMWDDPEDTRQECRSLKKLLPFF